VLKSSTVSRWTHPCAVPEAQMSCKDYEISQVFRLTWKHVTTWYNVSCQLYYCHCYASIIRNYKCTFVPYCPLLLLLRIICFLLLRERNKLEIENEKHNNFLKCLSPNRRSELTVHHMKLHCVSKSVLLFIVWITRWKIEPILIIFWCTES